MPKSGPPLGISDKQEELRRLEKSAEAWDLRVSGLTVPEIVNKTGVPKTTIYRWLKENEERLLYERDESVGKYLDLTVARNENIYKIAFAAISQTVTNDDGTEQVFMDHKSADIALKALKEMARLMALGAKEEKTGSETLEALILASLGQKEVPQIVEVEVEEVKDD